jgi:hypothetical protein
MNILRRMPDGTLHLGYASLSHRNLEPVWMLGDIPLHEAEGEIIARGSEAEKMFMEHTRSLPPKICSPEKRIAELEQALRAAIALIRADDHPTRQGMADVLEKALNG